LLPSGNDAAHQLAEYFGALLKKYAEDTEAEMEKERKKEKEREK